LDKPLLAAHVLVFSFVLVQVNLIFVEPSSVLYFYKRLQQSLHYLIFVHSASKKFDTEFL